MDYPISLTRPSNDPQRVPVGFAVANDAGEHEKLSAAGYEPKYIKDEADPDEDDGKGHTVAEVRDALDKLGIAYDKRMGLAKLQALLPA